MESHDRPSPEVSWRSEMVLVKILDTIQEIFSIHLPES